MTTRIGDTKFTTTMFGREGTWFLPVKAAVGPEAGQKNSSVVRR